MGQNTLLVVFQETYIPYYDDELLFQSAPIGVLDTE